MNAAFRPSRSAAARPSDPVLERRALFCVAALLLAAPATLAAESETINLPTIGPLARVLVMSEPTMLPQEVVSVAYRLSMTDTGAIPPEMRLAEFGVSCHPHTGVPVELLLLNTALLLKVGGTFVQDREEKYNPPHRVSLDLYDPVVAEPANAVCQRAAAKLKRK